MDINLLINPETAPSTHTQPSVHGAPRASTDKALTSSLPLGPGIVPDGPVLPAISGLPQYPNPTQYPQFHTPNAEYLDQAGLHLGQAKLYQGQAELHIGQAELHIGQAGLHLDLLGRNGSPYQAVKRRASQTPLPEEIPAKKLSKWTPDEDNLVTELRGQGVKWDDIAKRLPSRSSLSCRLRYQNYLEKRESWDEEKKNKLARIYYQLKDQMWQKIATEMDIPWQLAEAMHWQLGEHEMSARANAPVFQLHPSATDGDHSISSQAPTIPTPVPIDPEPNSNIPSRREGDAIEFDNPDRISTQVGDNAVPSLLGLGVHQEFGSPGATGRESGQHIKQNKAEPARLADS